MLASVGLTAVPASAEPIEPVGLVYRAHAGCPDASQFWRSVASRTKQPRHVDAGDAPRTFQVTIERKGGESLGHLVVLGRDGRHEEREARDGSCEEVAEALAIMLALTIDSQVPPPVPVASSPPPRVAPPLQAPSPPPSPSTPAPHPNVARPGLEGALGVHALAEGATSSGISWGGAFFGQIGFAQGWRPAFRASIESAHGLPVALVTGAARTELLAGAFDACPVRFAISTGAFVGPCARVELGVLRAAGLELPDARSTTAPWLAFGGVGRLEWAPIGVWQIEVQGGAVASVPRHALTLGPPRTEVEPLPAVGATFSAGVGVRFL
jgi:hypothetical protein